MLQPALLAGLVIGVLSALPFINMGNCCCCLWVVGGGVLAAYLLQANAREPITPGDGALVGLVAGLVGALVFAVISVPITALVGPVQARMLEQFVRNQPDLPDEVRQAFTNMGAGSTAVSVLIAFMAQLLAGIVFATIGGLIGAVIFRRGTAAPAAAPAEMPPPGGTFEP